MKLFCSLSSILTMFLAFTYDATAAYENTEWNMPLEKVVKLYPGGKVKSSQDGKKHYSIIKSVADMSGNVMFFFSKDSLLESVTIIFPKLGTDVDLNTGRYTTASEEEAKVIFWKVNAGLTAKYGDPILGSKKDSPIWKAKNGDNVVLSIGEKVTVSITYLNGSGKTSTEGL